MQNKRCVDKEKKSPNVWMYKQLFLLIMCFLRSTDSLATGAGLVQSSKITQPCSLLVLGAAPVSLKNGLVSELAVPSNNCQSICVGFYQIGKYSCYLLRYSPAHINELTCAVYVYLWQKRLGYAGYGEG